MLSSRDLGSRANCAGHTFHVHRISRKQVPLDPIRYRVWGPSGGHGSRSADDSLSTKVVMLVVSAASLLSSSASSAARRAVCESDFLQSLFRRTLAPTSLPEPSKSAIQGNGILKLVRVVAPTATGSAWRRRAVTNAGTLATSESPFRRLHWRLELPASFTVRDNSQSVTVNVQLAIPSAPVLSVSPTSFSVQANVGSNVSARTVQVSNTGAGRCSGPWGLRPRPG